MDKQGNLDKAQNMLHHLRSFRVAYSPDFFSPVLYADQSLPAFQGSMGSKMRAQYEREKRIIIQAKQKMKLIQKEFDNKDNGTYMDRKLMMSRAKHLQKQIRLCSHRPEPSPARIKSLQTLKFPFRSPRKSHIPNLPSLEIINYQH